MRTKYNIMYTNEIKTGSSNIKKYLGEEIETLLNPEAGSIHNMDFESLYVPVPEIEEQLKPLKDNGYNDRCVFLTGVTGCGKSSILNHVFQINKKVHIDENKTTLVIPFSFDHSIAAREKEKIETYLVNIIKVACELVKKELIKDKIHVTDEGFFEYIKTIRYDDLQHGDDSENGTIKQRLDLLYKNDVIDYVALKLKYYLSVLKRINHVVLVVDDIESVGYKMELIPIDIGLTFWSCLKHQKHKVWSSCIVISCRHYVYRMIRKRSIDEKYTISSGIDSQTIESYPIDDEINIPKAVKLFDIVFKRVEALKRVKNTNRWNDAWRIIKYILMKTDDNMGDFIIAISINNIRTALILIKKVVLNQRWIQRNWEGASESSGAFRIDSINQYNIKLPSVLRAIGMGEGNIYIGEDSDIPNILWNTIDVKSDFITLLVLKLFMHQCNYSNNSWRVSLDRFNLVKRIKQVIRDKDTHEFIESSTDYLIKTRLLLRSKNQAQDDGIDINTDNVRDVQYVYVADQAFELWNHLAKSSVLFEMLTDDVFISYDLETPKKLNFSQFDTIGFERCIRCLTGMVELEKNLRYEAENDGNTSRLNDLIGADFITEQLLSGLTRSCKAYFKEYSDLYTERLNRIKSKIQRYKNALT